MRALHVIKLERPRERVEDLVGDAADAAALDARVVLERDAGQEGDLLAPQARDAAAPLTAR